MEEKFLGLVNDLYLKLSIFKGIKYDLLITNLRLIFLKNKIQIDENLNFDEIVKENKDNFMISRKEIKKILVGEGQTYIDDESGIQKTTNMLFIETTNKKMKFEFYSDYKKCYNLISEFLK